MSTRELAKKMIREAVKLDGNSDRKTIENWIKFLKKEDHKRNVNLLRIK